MWKDNVVEKTAMRTLVPPYKYGFIVGRFQHIHKGHQIMIDTARYLCENLLVMVGSSQISGTERNPLNVNLRKFLIEEIYSEQIKAKQIIVGILPDMTHENDVSPEWGRFVLKNVEKYLNNKPNVMIYGMDERRGEDWFDPEDVKDMARLIVPRENMQISATKLREYMAKYDYNSWKNYVDESILPYFEAIRSELIKVPFYRDMYLKEYNYEH